VFAVSDRTSQLSRGDGGGVQSQRHGPAEADEWGFLNTKLANDAVTQQARPQPSSLCPPSVSCWLLVGLQWSQALGHHAAWHRVQRIVRCVRPVARA
jgi:hypothetical protein